MDLEARSLQPSVKAGLLAKLREYKSDLSSVKSEVKRVSAPNAHQATREELLEAGMSDTLAVSSLSPTPTHMNIVPVATSAI
jgi:vesicle transport through interaction with t-SNAREs protein 1